MQTDLLGLAHLFEGMVLGVRGPELVAGQHFGDHEVLVHLQQVGVLHEDAVLVLQVLVHLALEVGQQLLQQLLDLVTVGKHGRLSLAVHKVEG